MATNPMQKKSRNAFILGMLLMCVITAIIVAMLYIKLKNQKEEIDKFKHSLQSVYILNQDVKSGQVLTADMFTSKQVPISTIPNGATTDIITTLASASISTTDGQPIYYHVRKDGDAEDQNYYFIMEEQDGKQEEQKIYRTNSNQQEELATDLKISDKAYFGDEKKEIQIAKNAVVAKVEMHANTVITNYLISRSEELTTNDLKKEEYNVIALPVDLAPGDYVDIRLMLPNGQNYVVVSKKRINIPVVNGEYLSDTIQMNMTEEEIMLMSGAIVESYKSNGAKLYAERYIEAGLQESAKMTYYPSNDVIEAMQNDTNIVLKAIKAISQERKKKIREGINSAVSNDNEDNVQTKTEESITSTQEQRKNYLQTLPVIQ